MMGDVPLWELRGVRWIGWMGFDISGLDLQINESLRLSLLRRARKTSSVVLGDQYSRDTTLLVRLLHLYFEVPIGRQIGLK